MNGANGVKNENPGENGENVEERNESGEKKETKTDEVDEVNEADETDKPEKSDEETRRSGCSHYKRRAKFVTPCCNKFYMCRYCHDESESHYFNRKSVTELICTECDTRQKVQAECEKCGVRFGKYTCLICNLFDDEDKKQYHCEGCGICRVGGREKFFHCAVCNMCLPVQLIDGHKCVENVSRSNCPVCLEDIHTSRIPCHIPDCGHLLHRTCFEELLHSGHYACPTCQTSMIDMSSLWRYLDSEIALMPMPPEYAEYKATILCKDCHKLSTVIFHVVGLKCSHCGGYNTCQTNGQKKSEGNVENLGENSSTSTNEQTTSNAVSSSDTQLSTPIPSSLSSPSSSSSSSTSSSSVTATTTTTTASKVCNCQNRQSSSSESKLQNGQTECEKNDESKEQSEEDDAELPRPCITDEPPQA